MLRFPLKAKEIAKIVDGEIYGNENYEVFDIKESFNAGYRDLTIWDGKSEISENVGIVISSTKPDVNYGAFIKVKNHRLALAKLLKEFEPRHQILTGNFTVIEDGAVISERARVGAFCYVSSGAVIEDDVIIYPYVFIGRGARIKKGSVIYPFVYIGWNVEVGERCIIYPGSVIGSEGFGFERTDDGWVRIPQIGSVIIEDDVRIGANTTIDRATFGKTVIGKGTKIDNLVQIAHNVKIGENVVIASQTGISGGTEIGNWCIFAGQVGITEHIKIGNKVILMAGSGVDKDVKDGEVLAGKIPARERLTFWKSAAMFYKLPEIYRKLKDLEKKLKDG